MSGHTITTDPVIIVYAARNVLGTRGSHAPIAVVNAICVNAGALPPAAREHLIRDITAWLDGPGALAPVADREPWVVALDVLGVRRSALPVLSQAPTGRRRTDQPSAATS